MTGASRMEIVQASAFGPLRPGDAPLYQRIAEQIAQRVRRLRLRPGAQLPTEEAFGEHFGVSAITMRSALKELQTRGVIDRQQGRGTFVKRADAVPPAWGLGSVEDLVMTSRLTEVRLLRCARDPVPGWAADHLGAAGRAQHVRITRIQDGTPFMTTDAFYPDAIGAVLDGQDLARVLQRRPLLIEMVEQLTGERVTDVHQTMGAALSNTELARNLGVRRGTPVLVVTRVNHAADGRVLQVARSHYRTGDVAYSIHLKRG